LQIYGAEVMLINYVTGAEIVVSSKVQLVAMV